jgi:hypothetical protein
MSSGGPGDPGHVRSDAAELVRKSPEVILANGPVPTLELQRMTGSIPIVFVQVPVCVPKIRFCSIGDEGHQGQVVM